MRPTLALIVLALTGGCECGVNLRPVEDCGKPCGTSDTGACALGVYHCLEDGGMECVGAVYPTPETCNNSDDDCDGVVDRLFTPCSSACGTGGSWCSAGEWTACSAPDPKPEACNARDDDCDGLVDEAADVPVAPCYDGPEGTLSYGECRFGVTRCQNGKSTCHGQVLPSPEACNGKDDDCDGLVDEGLGNDVDVVFLVDNSCSMSMSIALVKNAAANWSTARASPRLRFALVGAPDIDPTEYGPTLYRDFTDAPTFATAMGQQTGMSGHYNEPTLDALYGVLVGTNPLGLSWRPRPTKRLVVLFTDEPEQSYVSPAITPADVVAANTYPATVVIFSGPSNTYAWPSIAPTYPLDQNIESRLDAALTQVTCVP